MLNPDGGSDGLAKVTKVGRKWFEIDRMPRSRFSLDDWHEDTNYSACVELWESEQAYEDHIDATKISQKLSHNFSEYGKARLSLSTLQKIMSLIEVEE
jgi:hypothetical protein